MFSLLVYFIRMLVEIGGHLVEVERELETILRHAFVHPEDFFHLICVGSLTRLRPRNVISGLLAELSELLRLALLNFGTGSKEDCQVLRDGLASGGNGQLSFASL